MRIGSFTSVLGPLDDVAHRLTQSVCPLFVFEGKNKPFLIGTAVPARIGRASVLVTAAHVLAPYGGVSVLTLARGRSLVLDGERRGFGYEAGRHVDVDLAVIVLSDDERETLSQFYEFCFSIEFAEPGDIEEISFYVLAGYPHSRNKLSPQLMRGTVVANYFISRTRIPLSDIPSSGKSAGIHFAIGASATGAIDLNRTPTGFPSPIGMSGGGVWRFFFPSDPRATPTAKLVGIGIEYWKKPGALVCTRIHEVEQMVEDLQR